MTKQERLRNNIDIIKNRYNSGDNLRDIAKDYNCNCGTLWYVLKQYNYLKEVPKPNRTKDYERQILDLWNNGSSVYAISKEVNISKGCILKFLNFKGIDTSVKSKQRPLGDKVLDYTENILELYGNGYNQSEIAQTLNCSSSSVYRLLKKEGIETRDNTTYSVHETFFSKIDTPEKAYILGWMYSDGNVCPSGKFRIQIQSTDDYILEWIKKQLEYTGPLYYLDPPKKFPDRKRQTCLCINRKVMCDDLISWGCIPNKSLLLTFPTNLHQDLMSHFLRGFFDGDGSISQRKTVSITSTDIFCKELNVYLKNILGIGGGKFYYRYKNKNTVSYTLNKKDTRAFLDYLYTDATIYLSRKHDLYKELCV